MSGFVEGEQLVLELPGDKIRHTAYVVSALPNGPDASIRVRTKMQGTDAEVQIWAKPAWLTRPGEQLEKLQRATRESPAARDLRIRAEHREDVSVRVAALCTQSIEAIDAVWRTIGIGMLSDMQQDATREALAPIFKGLVDR